MLSQIETALAGITKKEALESVEKKFGSLVSIDEMPRTFQVLTQVFQALSSEQAKRVNSHISASEIRIIKSDTINAFVMVLKDDGKARAKNLVFLTTGILKKYLPINTPDYEIVNRVHEIAAILAHELGHPTDKLDSRGIEDHYGRPGSQAVELKADSEGVEILKAAGFPADSLYRALKRLFANTTPSDALRAGVSTHPDHYLRLSSQKIRLAVDRIQEGEPSNYNEISISKPQILVEEIANASAKNEKVFVKLPGSLSEARELFTEYKWSEVKLNALVLWLDQYLRSNTGPETIDFLQDLRQEFVNGSISNGRIHAEICRTKACLEKILMGVQGIESLNFIPHRDQVEKIPQYAISFPFKEATNVADWMSQDAIKSHIRSIDPSAQILAMERAFDPFPGRRIGESRNFTIQEMRSWAFFLHTELVPAFKLEPGKLSLSGVMRFENLIPSQISRNLWRAFYSRASSAEEIKMSNLILRSMWENRGFWAYHELVSTADLAIDWDFVAEKNGVSRQMVKLEVQRSAKKYILETFVTPEAQARFADLKQLDKTGWFSTRAVKPIWLNAAFGDFLRASIDKIADQNLKATLSRHVLPNFYYFEAKNIKSRLSSELDKTLSGQIATLKELFERIDEAHTNVLGLKRFPQRLSEKPYEVTIERVMAKDFSDSLKDQFLLSMFFNAKSEYSLSTDNLTNLSDTTWDFIFQTMAQRKLVKDFSDFYKKIARKDMWFKEKPVLAAMANSLVAEVKSYASGNLPKNEYLQYIERISFLLASVFKANEFHKAGEVARSVIEGLSKYQLSLKERLSIFNRLTKIATNAETDMFFSKFILPEIQDRKAGKTLKDILSRNQISNSQLQVELAKKVLDGKLKPGMDLFDLNDAINELSPKDSNDKDKLYESLAWQLDIAGQPLKAHIEDEKMNNWKKLDPRWVGLASTVSAYVQRLTPTMKLRLADFVIKGGVGMQFPEEILEYLRQDMIANQPKSVGSAAERLYLIDKAVAEAKQNIELFVRESSPLQRVPILEIILSAGERNLSSNPSIYDHLLSKYSGLEFGSLEEVMLRAYMDVIPEHERTVTLAYVLLNSQGASGNQGLRSILEMFGTVGVKFGQMAATWRIFGDKYQEQLEQLFDKAAPMTKFQIEEELKKHFPEGNYGSKIKHIVKILGSASVKTVVLAELQNGKSVAVMLKRPFAANQIRSNLTLANKFLDRLKAYALESSNPLFMPLVEAIESQIFTEINFENEIKNYNVTLEIVSSINKSGDWKSSGWSVEVPKVSKDLPQNSDLFAVDAVSGMSAKDFFSSSKVSAKDKELVGEIIMKTSLAMLFKYGMFDPDRHPGNWIIDPETKTVHFIDPGQLTNFNASKIPWKWDPRVTLGYFLKALNDKDPKALVHYAKLMTDKIVDQKVDLDEIADKIGKIFSRNGVSEDQLMTKIIEELYRSGIKFNHTYTFGALKGLMVLSGSQYCSREKFHEILKSEIQTLLVKKAPISIRNEISKSVDRLKSVLGSKGSAVPLRCSSAHRR